MDIDPIGSLVGDGGRSRLSAWIDAQLLGRVNVSLVAFVFVGLGRAGPMRSSILARFFSIISSPTPSSLAGRLALGLLAGPLIGPIGPTAVDGFFTSLC